MIAAGRHALRRFLHEKRRDRRETLFNGNRAVLLGGESQKAYGQQGRANPEHIWPAVALLGVVFYGLVRFYLALFYTPFRVTPEEVGFSYAETIQIAAFALAIYAIVVGLFAVIAGVLGTFALIPMLSTAVDGS